MQYCSWPVGSVHVWVCWQVPPLHSQGSNPEHWNCMGVQLAAPDVPLDPLDVDPELELPGIQPDELPPLDPPLLELPPDEELLEDELLEDELLVG